MQKILNVGLVLAALLMVGAYGTAQATAVPELSGNYSVDVTMICQTTSTFPGLIASKLMLVNYKPATATASSTASINGVQTQGYLVVATGTTPGLTVTNISYTTPYTNTATTLTADGVTWNIEYGHVVNGIAQSYLSNGLYTVGGVNLCNGTGVAMRQ